MTYDNEYMNDVLDRVEQMVKNDSTIIDEYFPDPGPGMNKLNAEQHSMWFERNFAIGGWQWIAAMLLAEGGQDEIKRYVRNQERS